VLQHSFDGSLAAAAHAYPQSRYRSVSLAPPSAEVCLATGSGPPQADPRVIDISFLGQPALFPQNQPAAGLCREIPPGSKHLLPAHEGRQHPAAKPRSHIRRRLVLVVQPLRRRIRCRLRVPHLRQDRETKVVWWTWISERAGGAAPLQSCPLPPRDPRLGLGTHAVLKSGLRCDALLIVEQLRTEPSSEHSFLNGSSTNGSAVRRFSRWLLPTVPTHAMHWCVLTTTSASKPASRRPLRVDSVASFAGAAAHMAAVRSSGMPRAAMPVTSAGRLYCNPGDSKETCGFQP